MILTCNPARELEAEIGGLLTLTGELFRKALCISLGDQSGLSFVTF